MHARLREAQLSADQRVAQISTVEEEQEEAAAAGPAAEELEAAAGDAVAGAVAGAAASSSFTSSFTMVEGLLGDGARNLREVGAHVLHELAVDAQDGEHLDLLVGEQRPLSQRTKWRRVVIVATWLAHLARCRRHARLSKKAFL